MRTSRLLAPLATLVAIAGVAAADPTVTYAPSRSPVSANPREDADRSLAAGRFDEALELYRIALERDPDDRATLREAGRAAHAAGKLAEAAELLARAAGLTTKPDPELHYLLGEARWALGRTAEARASHERALVEIGPGPHERIERLWIARIEGRLGRTAAADAIYAELIAASPNDAEPALARAELHAGAKDWAAAERAVRAYLATDPEHPRARAMLAWFLEARGAVEHELSLREGLSREDRAEAVRDYGRALERSGDWAGALSAYRRARTLPGGETDLELSRALDRVDQRMSIEVGGGGIARTDPTASGYGAAAGVAVPFGRASHWMAEVSHELATSGGREVYSGEVGGGLMLRRQDAFATIGVRVGVIDVAADPVRMTSDLRLLAPGVVASASSGLLAEHLTVTMDAEAGATWRETPRAVFEAGRADSATTHLYLTGLRRRLVLDTGVQVRQLRIAPDAGTTPHARQLLAWGGADFLAWSDFGREARGQILDEDMLRPTYVADSLVIGYRHYELLGDTDPMFASRLALADRAQIDELSVTMRKVLARGAVALEGRGGFGRDWARDLYLTRGAVSVWIAPGARSRLSLSFELARESVRAFAGERRTGSVNYHVDL